MAQKEFKKGNFAKLFNYSVFFGDYPQHISWALKNSKTVDTLHQGHRGHLTIQRPVQAELAETFCLLATPI